MICNSFRMRTFDTGANHELVLPNGKVVLERCDIYLVSDLEPERGRSIFMEPFATVAEAYEKAKEKCGEDARVLVMPYGGSTLPKID